jgi:hypothetical protein
MAQYQMPRPMPPIGGPSAVIQSTALPPTAQPDQARYAGLQALRFQVAAPRFFDGPPSLQSYIFAVGQPQSRRQIQIPRAKAPIDVATVAVTQTDVFRSEQPNAARYAGLQALRFIVSAPARLDGATVQPSFVFQPNQPELTRFSRLQALRFVVDAPKRIDDGAAIIAPQTYTFPLSQPELRAWLKFDANRVPSSAFPRVDGATIQATYIFPVSQPEYSYYRHVTPAFVAPPQLGVTVIAAQTYEFKLLQPDIRMWPRANPDNVVGPAPQLVGATSQQTYVFTPNQPEIRAYALLQRVRGLGGSVAWPLETIIPLVFPEVYSLTGAYLTTVSVTGSYTTTVSVTGDKT